jgi:hypothetical protein
MLLGPDYHAASFGSKVCCTLAYMFVLAARGAVLDHLDDTCMRTLVSRVSGLFETPSCEQSLGCA